MFRSFLFLVGVYGGALCALGAVCYITLVGLVTPFVLRFFDVTRKTSRDGETLLEVPPRGMVAEKFYIHIKRNVMSKAIVTELVPGPGESGDHPAPAPSTWKFMSVSVFNLKIESRKPGDQKVKKYRQERDTRSLRRRSSMERSAMFVVNLIINATTHIVVLLLRYVEFVIHDLSVVVRGRSLGKIDVNIQDLAFSGSRRSFLTTRCLVGAATVKVTLNRGSMASESASVHIDRGFCTRAQIRASPRGILLGGWLSIRECTAIDFSLPNAHVDLFERRIGAIQDVKALISLGRCRPKTEIPTLLDMVGPTSQVFGEVHLTIGATQMALSLDSKREEGLFISMSQSSACVSNCRVQGVSSRHILVRLGETHVRSFSSNVKDECYQRITSLEDETVAFREAFQEVIQSKPDAFLRAHDLGFSMSTVEDLRMLTIIADQVLVATVPKDCAKLITAVTSFFGVKKAAADANPPNVEERHARVEDDAHQAASGKKDRGRPMLVRVDAKRICALVVSEVDTGFAETTAFSLLFSDTNGTKFSRVPGKKWGGSVVLYNLKNWHFMRCATTRNVNAKQFQFELTPYAEDRQWAFKCKDTYVLWDTDWQDFFDNVKFIVKPLVDLRRKKESKGTIPEATAETVPKKFSFKDDCRFFFENFFLEVKFPDAPKAAVHVGFWEDFCVNDLKLRGNDLYWIVNGTRVAYAKNWEMYNFFLTFKWLVKTVNVNLTKLRFFLPYDFHYGMRWADFWIRLRSYLKGRKAIRKPDAPIPKKQFPDLILRGKDVECTLQDHPLNVFLARRLPLWRDEAIQRLHRMLIFEERIGELPPQTQHEAYRRLLKQNSASYLRRVKLVVERENASKVQYAPHYEPVIDCPIVTLGVGDLKVTMFSDKEVVERGTPEHMRRFHMMDTCNLPEREKEKMDPDHWSELGFRSLNVSFAGVRFRLKDYPTSFASADNLDLTGVFGAGKQAVLPPFVTRTRVGVGNKLVADVEMPITPMKLFIDATVRTRMIQVAWNHAYMPGLMDFSRNMGRFVGEGKDCSPRMMNFDMMRLNHHVRIAFEAEQFSARIGVAHSPYARIEHYIDVAAMPFKFHLTRFRDRKFPMSLEFYNFVLRPRTFQEKSLLRFHRLAVQLDMKYLCREPTRNSVDHYLQPFVNVENAVANTAKLVQVSEPVVCTADPNQDELTFWHSDLDDIPNWDSFREWRARAVDITLSLELEHSASRAEDDFGYSQNSFSPKSVTDSLTSDGITTIRKILRLMSAAKPAVNGAPRWQDAKFKRRPPPTDTLGAVIRSTRIEATVKNIRMSLWNNLMPGSGLYIWLNTLSFEQTSGKINEDDMTSRSILRKRAAVVDDLRIDLKIPHMDIGGFGEDKDEGFLLHAKAITFTTVPENADVVVETDFGLQTTKSFTSPFHSISDEDERARGKAIDEVESRNKVSIQYLRLFVSPDRRDSIVHWRMALREKNFALMRHSLRKKKGRRVTQVTGQEILRRREIEIMEALEKAKEDTERQRSIKDVLPGSGENSSANKRMDEFQDPSKRILELRPIFHLIAENTQVMFASPETQGTLILKTSEMEVNFNRKKVELKNERELVEDEREWIVSAKGTRLYSVSADTTFFNHGADWLPDDVESLDARQLSPFDPITDRELILNLMFLSHAGASDQNCEVERVRPSTLYINVPVLSLDTTSPQFMIFRRVINMLNKRLPFALEVQNELSVLQYNVLRSLEHLTEEELQHHALQLKTICHQYEYVLETGETQLVKDLHPASDIYKERIRYIAKSKAFNTFMHKEHYKALENPSSEEANSSYPSMFFSCSFDRIEWTMRHTLARDPIAKLIVSDPVFNRIVYVGHGSSLEFTFTDINMRNMMLGASMSKVLALNLDEADQNVLRSTDNRRVAFKWSHLIKGPVGGINVYDFLTIKVAPLRADLTLGILKALKNFVVPPADPDTAPESREEDGETVSVEDSAPDGAREKDLENLRIRERTSCFFRYIYIGDIRLVASLKLKDENKSKLLDFLTAVHVTVKEHSHMYNAKLWSWSDFFTEIKRILNKMKVMARNQIIRDKMLMGVGSSRKMLENAQFVDDDDDDEDQMTNLQSEMVASSTVGENIEVNPNVPTPDDRFKELMFGIGSKAEKSIPEATAAEELEVAEVLLVNSKNSLRKSLRNPLRSTGLLKAPEV